MIFITGAAGKTGQSILQSLSTRGVYAKALVRSQKQASLINIIPGIEPVIGDLRQPETFEKSLADCDSIYFICPNVSPDELQMGKVYIELARKYRFNRFIYHSVLHPQVEEMPHHWQKMRLEETLFKSGLPFTILQPCAYMQNILGGWQKIISEGRYVVPYQLNTRISIVDLLDIGEVAAKIITEDAHANAIYELAGPQSLSQFEVATELSIIFNKKVLPIEQDRNEWQTNARAVGMEEYSMQVLLKMFEYYDKFGFTGNSNTLEFLLGRKPTRFAQFLERILLTGEN